MKKTLLALTLGLTFSLFAQEIKFTAEKSPMFTDEYKLSSLRDIDEDGNGGVTLARTYESYFGSAHGFIFEHYNNKMAKVKSKEFKVEKGEMVDVTVNGDIVTLIEFIYDKKIKSYVCIAHTANIKDFKFSKKELLRLTMKREPDPSPFIKSNRKKMEDHEHAKVIYNHDKSLFAVCIDINTGRNKEEVHKIYVYNKNLDLVSETTTKEAFEPDEYSIEDIAVTQNGSIYVLGKINEMDRKKRKNGPAYYYELLTFDKSNKAVNTFDSSPHYAIYLRIALTNNGVSCAGFYSDKGDTYQKGTCLFNLDRSGKLLSSKFSPFEESFTKRYSSRKKDDLDDFYFNPILITDTGDFLLHGEELKVNVTWVGNGQNMKPSISYEYKDILTAKITASGDIQWLKIIDKGQFTTGAASKYFSYTAMVLNNDIYYFINGNMTLSDNGSPYISYKGLENSDINIVRLSSDGKIATAKLLDKSEIKVPFMVSNAEVLPKIGEVYFLGREGKDKQLLKVSF